MKITIEGVSKNSSWEALQNFIRELTETDGKFIYIRRKDKKCNYRAPGEYDIVYRTDKDVVNIQLVVKQ